MLAKLSRSLFAPLTLAFALGCAPGGQPFDSAETVTEDDVTLSNQDPSKILIYTSNIENLSKAAAGEPESCEGDWQDLLYFLASGDSVPDIVLFQQVSDNAQLDDVLVARMEELFGEEYGTIIAERDPAPWDEADCAAKRYQTNAIVYRKSRFSYVDGTKKTWRSRVGEGCGEAKAARYVNVSAKLADRLRPHGNGFAEIAVGSVHWPVVDGCGVTNARAADEIMASYTGAQLRVFGGDANLPELTTPKQPGSGFRPWYRRTNVGLGDAGNLGYVDPVFADCAADAASEFERDACLVDNATMRFGSRYDFLFAKYKPEYNAKPVVTSGAITVDFDEAGAADAALTGKDKPSSYSMHKAVGAYVHW
jgi:hypothetical protein